MNKKFIVSSECGRESDPLDTREQAEKWVYECLPIGIQKCRTGCYDILEVNYCEKTGDWEEITQPCMSSQDQAGRVFTQKQLEIIKNHENAAIQEEDMES